MFGISGLELVIIVLFIFFIFGPDKLPELGRMLGKALRMFDEAKTEVEIVMKTEVLRPEDTKMVREVTRDFKDLKSSLTNPETLFGAAPRRPLETAEEMTEKVAAHTAAKAEEEANAAATKAEEEANAAPQPLERTEEDQTLAERIYAATAKDGEVSGAQTEEVIAQAEETIAQGEDS